MTDFQYELDAKDESCPLPVKKTKKILQKMKQGEVLHVMATDPTSEEDISILLQAVADELVETRKEDGTYHFYIKKL